MSDSNLKQFSTPTGSEETINTINEGSGKKKKRHKSKKEKNRKKSKDGDVPPTRRNSDPQVNGSSPLDIKSSMTINGPGGSDLQISPSTVAAGPEGFPNPSDPNALAVGQSAGTKTDGGDAAILTSDVDEQLDEKELKPTPTNSNEFIRHWKRHISQNHGYLGLFRFASPLDKIYILVGVITAIVGGLCIPLMIFIFGNMVRSMVLITQIEHSFNCENDKYVSNKFGDAESCKNFSIRCTIDKPFGGHALDDQTFLNQKIFESMKEKFVFWHVITAAVYTVCSSIYFICWHTAADNQISRMRRKYFEALLRKDMTWFDTQKDPDAVNRVMDHTRRVLEGIGENIPIAINLFVIFIVSVLLAFGHGWELSLMGLISIILLILTTWLVSYTDARKVVAEQRAYKIARDLADEILTNARIVTFYGGQKKELIRYKKELKRDFPKVLRWIFAHSFCVFLFWFMNFIVWAVIFWYGIALVILSQDCKESSSYVDYDSGDVITIILCIIFGAGNVYLVVPVVQSMRVARDYGRKVFKVIDGPAGIDTMDTEGISFDNLNPLKGDIVFDDVRFTYPNRKEESVLNHLNLNITAGNKVAIVGVNGCGKSTVIKLICKEYLPDSGFIRIDGMDIRSINTRWLRSQIGVVPQDANLFDDTIEANIKMGKLDAEFFEVQEACKSANAHNFIVSLKEAYQTKIGEYGCKLTAGQQQRIAIARALIRNPRILLLDEPTSSLDADSEVTVMETLEKVSKDRTVVVVAHRLHTVTNADQIYVLKRGKVAEKGVHANLVKAKGPYSQLASGLVDKPSNSIKEPGQIEYFDLTEVTTIHFMTLFSVKPLSPNLYNNLMNFNPVASQVSYRLVKEMNSNKAEISRGHIFEDIEEGYYTLERQDSIAAGDTQLSNSERNFKDRSPEEKAVLQSVKVVNSEVEGLKDIFDPNRYSFWQIFWLATGSFYKILLIIAAISSICLGLFLPIFGILFAEVVGVLSDATAIPGNWDLAKKLGMDNYYKWLIIGFAFLGFGAGLAAAFQEFALSLGNYKMIMYVRKKLFGSFLKQDMTFFENPLNSISSLRALLSNNVDALRYIISGFYATLLQCTVTVVFSITIGAIVYAGTLTGYGIAITIAVTAISFADGWLAKKQQIISMKALNEISALILQVFRGKHNVTILQLEPYFLEKFNDIQLSSLRKRRRISYFRAITFGFAQTGVFWAYSLFILLGANEIVHFGHTFLDVIAIGELLLFGFISLGSNLSTMPSFREAVKAGELVLNALQRQPHISNFAGEEITECTGKLGFIDTHFWYPYSGDNPLLKGVTFNIPAGKTIAIVGSSESGKSVFLDLVMRLYEITSGAITLDGTDIKHPNVLSLRHCIGYVEKQPQLFQRTVAENIAYGDNTKTICMKKIIEAATKTNMHDFIVSLPDGYETRIGGDNDRLTTAQKQRITVARALLRDPKILLIDEATSSLDREGEKLMTESIEAARQGRTCIIIAHRLQAIQKSDMIIMMNDGYIAEMGQHEDLVKTPNGMYGKLWRSQNPLEDDAFAKGQNWVGKATPPPPPPPKIKDRKKDPKPEATPPPPPEPEPDPIPEEAKVEKSGWMPSACGPQ